MLLRAVKERKPELSCTVGWKINGAVILMNNPAVHGKIKCIKPKDPIFPEKHPRVIFAQVHTR